MSATMNDFDIAICGAGPVGQVLALLLQKHGIAAQRIALFDAKTSDQAEQDARTIALSYGSQQILQMAGCWPVRATAIREIHVSRRGYFGRTLIRAEEHQVPALGQVACYGDIIRPMQAALAATEVQQFRPCLVENLEEADDHVRLNLYQPTTNTRFCKSANIVVQAEGGTFSDQSQRLQRHDYRQTALIAHVEFEQPRPGRAFERFTEQGPLALLPQDQGYALVWCVRPARAEQLMGLSDTNFIQALQQEFGQRMGKLRKLSARSAYPLGLNAQAQATARTVCIGNAAQTLHPVAGQGLNLGLRDAYTLAQCLGRQDNAGQNVLQQFLQQRHTDRQLTIRLTDTLARIFAQDEHAPLTQSVLGLGLGMLDMIPPLKKVLAGHMMYGWR